MPSTKALGELNSTFLATRVGVEYNIFSENIVQSHHTLIASTEKGKVNFTKESSRRRALNAERKQEASCSIAYSVYQVFSTFKKEKPGTCLQTLPANFACGTLYDS